MMEIEVEELLAKCVEFVRNGAGPKVYSGLRALNGDQLATDYWYDEDIVCKNLADKLEQQIEQWLRPKS